MVLSNLPSATRSKKRKRVGRGPGSGHGKTSCRGHKGQKSRSGSKRRVWFEGGQMPLQRRVPKRGFTNIFARKPAIINLSELDKIEETTEITPELLYKKGKVKKLANGIKVLGDGELTKALKISAHFFSKKALEKIKNAGGEAIILK
ncbi:MAG: 50S ribosomal protein L15 [Candidatus Schekmanbacteria bacterium]|nr:MAG: 50S ribosomal protein L15 [Candidatus Schekmanbacteria bacterium]